MRQVIPEIDAASSDIAQSLLAHYPGMRIIALCKRVDAVFTSDDRINSKDVPLFLKRISPDGNIPLRETPILHALAIFFSLIFTTTSIMMFRLARSNIHQIITNSLGQKIAQIALGTVLLATTLPPCGNMVTHMNNALITHKKTAAVLKIDPKKDHASGLYSTEIESCKTVDITTSNQDLRITV